MWLDRPRTRNGYVAGQKTARQEHAIRFGFVDYSGLQLIPEMIECDCGEADIGEDRAMARIVLQSKLSGLVELAEIEGAAFQLGIPPRRWITILSRSLNLYSSLSAQKSAACVTKSSRFCQWGNQNSSTSGPHQASSLIDGSNSSVNRRSCRQSACHWSSETISTSFMRRPLSFLIASTQPNALRMVSGNSLPTKELATSRLVDLPVENKRVRYGSWLCGNG